jgi:dihydrolipoamide dehydrogenase
MPRATYCEPQVASVGLTEAQARERGIPVRIGRFPLAANGKALAEGLSEGMAKVVVDSERDTVVGFHLIGEACTELLGQATTLRSLGATAHQIGELVLAHPTIAEVLREATLSAMGEAIHFWQGRPPRPNQ